MNKICQKQLNPWGFEEFLSNFLKTWFMLNFENAKAWLGLLKSGLGSITNKYLPSLCIDSEKTQNLMPILEKN